jgi:hypothetical protein
MTKIKWREVFKFLSGAALAASLANFYLWLGDISVLFLGFTITPRLLGLRAAVQFALFVVFLYFGWLRAKCDIIVPSLRGHAAFARIRILPLRVCSGVTGGSLI